MDLENLKSISEDKSMIALRNHLAEEERSRQQLLMKKEDFKKIKNRDDLDNFLKAYNENANYISKNVNYNEKSFMYDYLFENNRNDKDNVNYATKYSLLKNDTELLKKCLNQEVFKTLLEDRNINYKCNYLKTSKNECTKILLENLEFKNHELTFKLKEDLDSGYYNNVGLLIDKGADKDKVFLELSSSNRHSAINFLIDNQQFSKEVLEQGLINSIPKGELKEYEELNIFNEDTNVKSESTNIFNSLYEKFEFSKETYEKVIKEALVKNKYELVTEIIKEQEIIIKDTDLNAVKDNDIEQYEILNKINMKNKLSDKFKKEKELEELTKSLFAEPQHFVNKNKDLDRVIKI